MVPSDAPSYRSLVAEVIPVSPRASIVRDLRSNRLTLIDAESGYLLRMCREQRTLDDHAASIARALGGGDGAAFRPVLDQLVASALLECRPSASAPARRRRNAEPIRALVITTADRPAMLARCLDSYLSHCRAHGRSIRCLVMDDSRRAGARAANRAVVRQAQARFRSPVEYVGLGARQEMTALLLRRGFPPDLVALALHGGSFRYTVGANRNVALLYTAGESILCVDDDTICAPWTAARDGGLALTAHGDPSEWTFYETRQAARVAVAAADHCILDAHESALGWSLGDLLHAYRLRGIDTARASDGLLLAGVRNPDRAVVRVTQAAIAGDSGTYCPSQHLFATGATRDWMASSQANYTLALSRREVVRGVGRLSVTANKSCMAMCMGLANTSVLPPFTPVGRDEDGVFGLLLNLCEPLSLCAYLPSGIVHDSLRAPAYTPDERMPSASATRLSSALALLCERCPEPVGDVGPTARLTRLGAFLGEVARLDVREFGEFLSAGTVRAQATRVAQWQFVTRHEYDYPEFWAAGFDEYEARLLAHLCAPGFAVPRECASRAPGRGFGRLRTFVARYAELLQHWPEMWSVARAEASRGNRV